MDAFELLKKDHKKVSQLFGMIESATGKTKTEVFAQLKSELDVHAHVEEKILYPALENNEKSRDITLEAYEEHKVVKDLLAELAGSAPSDEWDAKLSVLKENVEHHVEEEEGELFNKAKDVLSKEQIDRLGAEMEAEKASKLGQTPPTRAAARKSAPAKAEGAAKTSQRPGVLKRLANFVGLGTSAQSSKKSGKSAKKAAPAKKAVSKAKSGGSAGKATKKSAAKATSKRAATKKSSKKQTAGKKKATTKSTPARKGAKKKAPARKR